MQWDGVDVRVWLFFRSNHLCTLVYTSRTSHPAIITLGVSLPSISREQSTLVWEKCFIFIKPSITAGSIAPSDNEEDIYHGWSLPRPVYVPPCSLSALPAAPPRRPVIMPCCRTLRRRKRWSPKNPWRRDGPRLPTCWCCVGGRSWRSCWQWRARGPAAARWWPAALWSGGGSPWRWPGACGAAGRWTPAWCASGPGCAPACSAPAPSACMLQADKGGGGYILKKGKGRQVS